MTIKVLVIAELTEAVRMVIAGAIMPLSAYGEAKLSDFWPRPSL